MSDVQEQATTMSSAEFDRSRLGQERDWYGLLTIDNAEAVADRISRLLGRGKRFTYVNCWRMPTAGPDVVTSTRISGPVASDINAWHATVSFSAARTSILLMTSVRTREEGQELSYENQRSKSTYLHFRHDRLEWEFYSPSGQLIREAAVLEQPEISVADLRQLIHHAGEIHGLLAKIDLESE